MQAAFKDKRAKAEGKYQVSGGVAAGGGGGEGGGGGGGGALK